MTQEQLRAALLDLAEFDFIIVNNMEDAEQVKAAIDPSLHVALHPYLLGSVCVKICQGEE